jgi:putative copper resistance protein D
VNEVLYACRLVHFAAAMVMFGTAAFRGYAIPISELHPGSSTLAEYERWSGRVMLTAAVIALISAAALVPCQAAAMAGSPSAAIESAAVTAVLFETRFGRVWCWHLLIAAVLLGACLGHAPRRPARLLLSLALLASLGWVGHAAMDQGPARIARGLNQSLHLLAAGLWLGGLVPLGWVLRQAWRSRGGCEISFAGNALRRFSQIGYIAVALVGLTGIVNTVLLVGSLDAFFGTAYGRLLGFKILLFLAMVAIALINRFGLAPRVSKNFVALAVLGRTVALEQGLGLAVLAIVSVLGTWQPALYGRLP